MQILENGTTLQGGKYRIEKVLGQGGFGITYQGVTIAAVGGDLGSMNVKVRVAIKEFYMQDFCKRDADNKGMLLTSDANRDKVEKYKKKFVEEAEKLADIDHPNIVKAIHVFEENNTVYYVMRFIDGGSLTHIVRTSPAGRLSEDQAVKYVRQIGEALSFLHNEKQMCHFDVKPANILVNGEDNAILIDFGISKTFSDTSSEQHTSSINYSNSYSPLELYQPLSIFSPQTDVYSLGATLYYLLTGTIPPEATDINNDGLPECPYYVSKSIWMAIDKAMQPRRRDRPQSMAQWIALLDPNAAGDDGETVVDDMEDMPTVCEDASDVVQQKVEKKDNAPVVKQDTKQSIAKKEDQPSKDVKQDSSAAVRSGANKKNLFYVAIIVLVLVVGVGSFVFFSGGNSGTNSVAQQESYTTEVALQKLNSPDVTCVDVDMVEKGLVNDGSAEEQELVHKKILALRHIYQRVLEMPDHDVKRLNMVYNTYDDIFSPEQIQIVVWFFNQPKSVQQKWEESSKTANSFTEFKSLVEAL